MGSVPGQEDTMEKETAIYFRSLAWEILWAQDPGRLQSLELQRVDTTYQLNNNNTYTQLVLVVLVVYALSFLHVHVTSD